MGKLTHLKAFRMGKLAFQNGKIHKSHILLIIHKNLICRKVNFRPTKTSRKKKKKQRKRKKKSRCNTVAGYITKRYINRQRA